MSSIKVSAAVTLLLSCCLDASAGLKLGVQADTTADISGAVGSANGKTDILSLIATQVVGFVEKDLPGYFTCSYKVLILSGSG